MKIGHVTIAVKNLEESLRFYQDILGLPVIRRFSPAPGTEIVFLGSGETEIELICNQAHTDIAIGQDISLGFFVKSLQETMESMRQKGVEPGAVIQPTPQIKFFFVSDPNGVRIQLAEEIG